MKNKLTPLLFIGLLVWSCSLKSKNEISTISDNQKDSLQRIACDSILAALHQANADTFGRVQSIPVNFNACLKQLDTLVNDKMKAWIICLPDGEFSSFVHHGFGMYLRNSWGLWGNSTLAKNLYEMGMLHPDDMTAIILDSYQRKLKGEDINLKEQLRYYQDYWRKSGMPVDSILQTIKIQE